MGCNVCKQQLGNEEQQEIKANVKKPQEKINGNNNDNNNFHTNSNGLMNSNYYNNNFNSEKSPSINGLSSKFYEESSLNNNNGKFKVTANFNNEVDSNFISHNNIYSNNSNSINNNNSNNNNLISFSKDNNNNNNKNFFNNDNNNNNKNENNLNSNEKVIDFNTNYHSYDILSQNSNQLKNNINDNNNNNKEIIKASIPIEISEKINENNQNNSNITYDPNLEPNDEFSRYIFHELNNIRQNPQNYIDLITKSESNILKDKKNRLIYKSKVKVALNKGLPSFEETINFLKNLQPMNRLYYLPKLTVDIPTTEEEIKDKNYLKTKVSEKIEDGINIKSYWRDIINDAETSFLLMIVDDTGMKPGMKRKNIFDSNMKFIGISSISINKYFACYIVFSDRDN